MMNTGRYVPRVLISAVVLLVACTRVEDAPTPDQHVDVLPAGGPMPAPASAGGSKIGMLPLMTSVQPGGKCEIVPYGGFNAITRDVRYEENFPPRFLKLGIGDSTRAFAPVKFDVTVRRESGIDQIETETLQIVFTPTGGTQLGYRQYMASADGTRERRDLTPQEIDDAKQLVTQLLETCKDAPPPSGT